jgi:pimeloyl-ACP methyl ester carboxylesterase
MLWQQAYHFSESFDDMNFTPQMLSQITTKTLIIQGDRDPIYPLELTIEMFKSMPNAYLWIVPNGGHGPITVDLIPEFTSRFKKFLSD